MLNSITVPVGTALKAAHIACKAIIGHHKVVSYHIVSTLPTMQFKQLPFNRPLILGCCCLKCLSDFAQLHLKLQKAL